MHDKLIHIAKHDFLPDCVHGKYLTHQGHIRYNKEGRHRRGENYSRDEVIIIGLWENQTDIIIDFIFGDADCATYNKDLTSSILDW